jgi:calcineurin-like phosphoesterase family protein
MRAESISVGAKGKTVIVTAGSGWDVIGDVHGHAERLETLLATLGFVLRDSVWTHSERKAAFVGDFIDRGPENLRACRIVMDMMTAGAAVAVMGNHDFNAVCLATHDPDVPGSFLRPHSAKNLHQTAATRHEMERDPQGAAQVLAWLRALPLWLEFDSIRLAHAAWSIEAMAALAPFLDARGALDELGLVRAARQGDPVRTAREAIINGPETYLPSGLSYVDADGHVRTDARLAWWKHDAQSWREVILVDEEVRARIPAQPLPRGLLPEVPSDKPIFFGHYWMRPPLAPLSPRLACVDASVAKGGRLAAYRYSGEYMLAAERFVYV